MVSVRVYKTKQTKQKVKKKTKDYCRMTNLIAKKKLIWKFDKIQGSKK